MVYFFQKARHLLKLSECNFSFSIILSLGNTENSSISHVTIKDEEEEVECTSNEVLIEDKEITPKDIWRVAIPWKSNQLFFRPATISKKFEHLGVVFWLLSWRRNASY